jgi:hypothetical protein
MWKALNKMVVCKTNNIIAAITKIKSISISKKLKKVT